MIPPPASPAPGTLVLGLGNPLMGDDGLGLAALERLAAGWRIPGDVRLLDGGTRGLQLLPDVEDAGRVMLLDAIEVGEPAGTLVVLEREELPRYLAHKLSPHDVTAGEVLALAELRGRLPAELVAVGLQPGPLVFGPGLSAAVRDGLEPMLAAMVSRLERWGHHLRRAGPVTHA